MFKKIYNVICLTAATGVALWTFYAAFVETLPLAIGYVFVTIMQIINLKMNGRFNFDFDE